VPWPFVVVRESVAIMAYCSHSFFEIGKLERSPSDRGFRPCLGAHGMMRPTIAKNRIKRVLRENVFDVRDKQFLMLLFVMNAEDENRLNFIEQIFVGIREQIVDV
jgi:hypothetical protein